MDGKKSSWVLHASLCLKKNYHFLMSWSQTKFLTPKTQKKKVHVKNSKWPNQQHSLTRGWWAKRRLRGAEIITNHKKPSSCVGNLHSCVYSIGMQVPFWISRSIWKSLFIQSRFSPINCLFHIEEMGWIHIRLRNFQYHTIGCLSLPVKLVRRAPHSVSWGQSSTFTESDFWVLKQWVQREVAKNNWN